MSKLPLLLLLAGCATDDNVSQPIKHTVTVERRCPICERPAEFLIRATVQDKAGHRWESPVRDAKP